MRKRVTFKYDIGPKYSISPFRSVPISYCYCSDAESEYVVGWECSQNWWVEISKRIEAVEILIRMFCWWRLAIPKRWFFNTSQKTLSDYLVQKWYTNGEDLNGHKIVTTGMDSTMANLTKIFSLMMNAFLLTVISKGLRRARLYSRHNYPQMLVKMYNSRENAFDSCAIWPRVFWCVAS